MKYLLILLLSTQAFCEERIARIYEIGKTDSAPLFTQKSVRTESDPGHIHAVTTITDPENKVVIVEDAEFKGDRLIHQHIQQFQTQKAFDVLVDGKKVTFRTYVLKDGKETESEKANTEDFTDEFITGPVSENFLAKNWKELLDGDTIHTRFGVPEIAESVGFKFFQVNESKDAKTIEIRMKPSSIFISMALKPIELFFDPKTHQIVRYLGRTPLKWTKTGKLENIDADILYDAPK
jgi:hypothetical protein